jgi:hypothetical protein
MQPKHWMDIRGSEDGRPQLMQLTRHGSYSSVHTFLDVTGLINQHLVRQPSWKALQSRVIPRCDVKRQIHSDRQSITTLAGASGIILSLKMAWSKWCGCTVAVEKCYCAEEKYVNVLSGYIYFYSLVINVSIWRALCYCCVMDTCNTCSMDYTCIRDQRLPKLFRRGTLTH